MAALRCERVADGDVDRAIADLGSCTLVRAPEGSFVELEDGLSARAQRLLAFAGVRTTMTSRSLEPLRGTRPAIGRDLTPLPLTCLALDLVHVRTLPIGPETKGLRGSRWRRPSAARRMLVRDLLHGDDAVVAWRRRAWTTRDVLRTSEVRRALRPVIFDLAAIAAPPEHRLLARDGALARWLFA